MANKARDIGAEILQGLREIKRGEFGRVIDVPDVARTREKTGLSQARFDPGWRAVGLACQEAWWTMACFVH